MAKFRKIWPVLSIFGHLLLASLRIERIPRNIFFPVEPTLGPNIPALQVKQLFLDGVLDRYVSLIGSYQNLAVAITRPVQIYTCF